MRHAAVADPQWLFLTLVGCANLDLETLRVFRGNERLTLRLTNVRFGEKGNAADEVLLRQARLVLGDGRGEQECGIQIR